MRIATSMTVAALTTLMGIRSAEARTVAAEPSHFGSFALAFDAAKSTCTISFKRGALAPVALFAAHDCTDSAPGITSVVPVEMVGAQPFPIARNGEEFHLFHVASARGGNAVAGSEYWGVVLKSDGQWATPTSFEGTFILSRQITDTATTLILDDPATTTSDGARVTIAFGKTSTFMLPKLPSWPISKASRAFDGVLEAPAHVSNFKYYLEEENTSLLVDDNGACGLKSLEAKRVHLTAEVTTWDDGRTTTKCLDVKTSK